jgi:PAS domain-containing protein
VHAAISGEGVAQGAVQGAVQELPVAGEAPVPFAETGLELALLDRIPLGVLVYRDATLLYANRHFLEWSGYDSAAAIERAGGLPMLFAEPSAGGSAIAETSAQSLAIKTAQGDKLPVEGRMFRVPWNGSAAIALILTNDQFEAAVRHAERARRTAERELGDLKSVLDAASDGVAVLDTEGNIITANARAVGLFAKPVNELAGSPFVGLFATEHEHGRSWSNVPIGNERYRGYVKDIHIAGTHLTSMINDLLDLSKIETGRMELTFADISLNDLTQQCVVSCSPRPTTRGLSSAPRSRPACRAYTPMNDHCGKSCPTCCRIRSG